MRSIDLAALTLSLTLAAAGGLGAAAVLSPAPIAPARKAPTQPDIGQLLIDGLRTSPGCLGVDAAQWESGKASIVAWFEDKDAVIAWYDSEVHQRVMQGMDAPGEPLAHVPDDQGPIMVMATITPSETPEIEGFPVPISQISIELFAPLPGGAHVNGRLAPEEFVVEHMRDLTGAP